jgi:hypothetical protein
MIFLRFPGILAIQAGDAGGEPLEKASQVQCRLLF